VHRLVQVLSDVPNWQALADALLGTVADTTNAARVLLFTGDAESLGVRAVCEAGLVTLVDSGSADIRYDGPSVREAARTGRPVLVTGELGAVAGRERRQRPEHAGSVTLTVPVRMRGSTIGAIYAEHHEPVRAFGPGQQDALVAMCAQAAAPMWNLEMEGRLRLADDHRHSLMDAQSRFIPAELLRILDLDDISRVRQGHRVERRMTVLLSDIRGAHRAPACRTVSQVPRFARSRWPAVHRGSVLSPAPR